MTLPVSFNELNTLDGIDITQTIQGQINAIVGGSIPLTNGKILVGNASNVATGVTMSGDVTTTNAGVTTVANAAVIGKVITGYVAGAGVVAATDTILVAINKLSGNIAAITGASGTFTTSDPFTVTVVNGLITSIV